MMKKRDMIYERFETGDSARIERLEAEKGPISNGRKRTFLLGSFQNIKERMMVTHSLQERVESSAR